MRSALIIKTTDDKIKQIVDAIKINVEIAKVDGKPLIAEVYPLIDNHRWYAENGTVYNEADETVRIVLLHDNGSYSNLPNKIAMMISSALNSR